MHPRWKHFKTWLRFILQCNNIFKHWVILFDYMYLLWLKLGLVLGLGLLACNNA